MNKIDKKRFDLLKELTTTHGISGYESLIKKIIKNEIKNPDKIIEDNIGNFTFEYNSNKKPAIMLIAHMDELGFIVSDILENGLLKFQTIGSWDKNTLLSSPVEVINRFGEKFYGIIGSLPVHYQSDKNYIVKTENMFIDIGAKNIKQVKNEMRINLGDEIVPFSNFHYVKESNHLFGKAFDDRAGIAVMIEIAEYFSRNVHPNKLIFSASTQEEIGGRGSMTLKNYLNPDICIVLEGAPADDFPGLDRSPQTGLDYGAHIRIYDVSMIAKKELRELFIDTAEKYNIKYQLAVRKGGGTDGGNIQSSFDGVPSIVLGVPVRYAHSHNGCISLNDFDNLVELLKKIINEFDEKTLEKLK
jgi:endoglucanase